MNASQVLQQMADRYSHCRSYSDRGIVDFPDVNGTGERIEFRTEFLRPDYLTFEWQDYGPRRGKSERFSMLWYNGAKSLIRWDTSSRVDIEEEHSLRLALAGATGCSAGGANIVPALIVDEIRSDCKNLALLTNVELMPEEILDGRRCYVVKGTLLKQDDHILWVMADDFSLRRVIVKHSETAEEAEQEHKALLANTELMTRLAEHGIAPPAKMSYRDSSSQTQYTYLDVSFDRTIARVPQPA